MDIAQRQRPAGSGVRWLVSATVLLALFVGAQGMVRAEPVSINSPAGQGIAFSHQGNCYVVLPEHVHTGTFYLSLSAGSPPVVGAAQVIQTFSDSDLSFAFVTGGLEGRCKPEFTDLPRDIENVIAPGGDVTFVTVSEAGRIQRVRGRIATLAYEHMSIEVVDEGPDTDMFQGRSGGVVFAENSPVGMLVEAEGRRRSTALRMDAIVARIDRLLRSLGAESPDTRIENTKESDEASSIGIFGQISEITHCSAESVSPDTTCWSLEAGTGPLLVPNDKLPFEIEVQLEEGAAVNHVNLSSELESDVSTAPKTVLIERAAGSPDRQYWLSYGRADMSPLGYLTISHGASLRTRALRITVLDAWDASLPFRIDRIEVR